MCDKLLLVVNKIHVEPNDLIIIPAKTRKDNDPYPYKAWCDPLFGYFYFEKQIGFYKAGSVLQLHFIESIPLAEIIEKINKGRIKRLGKSAERQEMDRIVNCLWQYRNDIPEYIQDCIF